jgi:hypothetical protein
MVIDDDEVKMALADHIGINFQPKLGETLEPYSEQGIFEVGEPFTLVENIG